MEHFLPRVSATGYLLPLPFYRLPLQHLEERLEVQKSLSCRLLVQRMAVQKSNCTADEGPEVLNPFTAMMSLENGKKEKEKKNSEL